MTEDDTYNKLMKPTFREMFHLLSTFHNSMDYFNAKDRQEASAIFLNKYSWGLEEYIASAQRTLNV